MNKRPVLTLTGTLVLATILAGCSLSSGHNRNSAANSQGSVGSAQFILAEAASNAAQAQNELVRIQTARTLPAPAPVNENMAGVPEALRTPTTLQWSGPGDEPARRIAAMIGYEFRITGNPPATKPMVNVSHTDVPAIRALEDIGNQVQPFAQIVLDANLKRIEYRYLSGNTASASGAPGMTK